MTTAERIAAATATTRDRYVDFLRVASIVVVVLAHWALALLVLDGTTALGHSRAAHLATWVVMVMPVFFAVGGFSHAKAAEAADRRAGRLSYTEFVRSRVMRLLRPVVVSVGVWVVAAAALDTVGLGRGPVGLALDRALTPLWFVAVYLVVVALALPMRAVHRRMGGWALLPLVATVAGLDWLRYQADVPWAGPVNIVVVWVTIHQLGYLWADGRLLRRGVPVVLAVTGLGVTVFLTLVTGWYPVDMQGLPGSPAANFAPPNLALLAHGFALVGVVLLVRAPVTRWLQGPRMWSVVVAVGSVIMTVFCWHLTAVFVVQGALLAAGVHLPAAGTASWWALLPVWSVVCLVPLTGLVAVFRRFERMPGTAITGRPVTPGRMVVGVLAMAAGTFVVSQVGLDGVLTGATEPVFGVLMAAWTGVTAGVLGWVAARMAAPYGRPLSLCWPTTRSRRPQPGWALRDRQSRHLQ